MILRNRNSALPSPDTALPGRSELMPGSSAHDVLGHPLRPPFPAGIECAVFALGCFWGAERVFWQQAGVYTTAVGYTAGFTPNPTYDEVCSGQTGHSEAVLVAFESQRVDYATLLALFWESHDPTQGMRQGNDKGTQYRSGIYFKGNAQRDAAQRTMDVFQAALLAGGRGTITTEIKPATEFYYAEEYHQQYLARNPTGYCGLGGTGIHLRDSRLP
jgi:peptide-methionine (S)-S-oxide reductase